MKVQTKHLRRGGAVLSVAAGGLLVGLGSASGYVGGVGSGPLPHSNAPDLESAVVTRTVDPGDAVGPQVRYCFDGPIASATALAFNVGDYDAARVSYGGTAVVDPQQPSCVVMTFAAGRDIEQYSTASVDPGGATGNGGVPTPAGMVPLQQMANAILPLKAEAGHTTGPELIGAEVTGQKEVTYTFDERIDPTPGAAYSAAKFGYYQDSANGAAPTTGTGAVQVSRNRAIVQFANTITSAKQFEVQQAAVQDVDSQGAGNTPSTIGNAGTQITGSPGLVSATRNADLQTVNMTFSQAVNPGAAAGVIAYREDGAAVAATAVTTTNDSENKVLKATFPPSLQKDPAEVVRVVVLPNGATARSGTNGVTTTSAAIGTCKCTPGYTDSPDLLATSIHDDTNTVDFVYDEPLRDSPEPLPANFRLLQPDGTTISGQDGVVLSGDRKTVTVHFGSSVSATVGVANVFNAVVDASPTANGNGYNYGTVGKGPVQQCQQGSCNGTPTPTPTPPGGGGGDTKHVKATLASLKHKKSSKKVTGKVSAAAPCAAGRTVSVVKDGKTIASAKSKANGSFSLSSKKAKGAGKNKLTVKVAKRTIGTTICDAASKKV